MVLRQMTPLKMFLYTVHYTQCTEFEAPNIIIRIILISIINHLHAPDTTSMLGCYIMVSIFMTLASGMKARPRDND